MSDVLDRIAGLPAGSPVDALRRRRPVTRDHSQGSWEALFQDPAPGSFASAERFAVALFVARVSGDPAAADVYRRGLVDAGRPDWAEVFDRAPDVDRRVLGPRLSAALDHADLLVFRPREASRGALEVLAAAGWSTDDLVTLSQLVGFVTYQLKVAAGLRVLAEVTR